MTADARQSNTKNEHILGATEARTEPPPCIQLIARCKTDALHNQQALGNYFGPVPYFTDTADRSSILSFASKDAIILILLLFIYK